MAAKDLPSADVLRQLLRYDPETGKLFWRERGPEWFTDGFRTAQGNCNIWNARYAGSEAFTSADRRGCKMGRIGNAPPYLAHRVIWKIVTGVEPAVIDHLDGDPGNNRFSNLRSVDTSTNGKNRRIRPDCPHGHPGLQLTNCPNRPWRASIGVNRKIVYLGAFESKEDALAARLAAEKQYGFHQR